MKKKTMAAIGLLVALIAVLAAVYFIARPKPVTGAKSFTLLVVNDEGATTEYKGRTDAEYVGDALREMQTATDFTMAGSESEYGFFLEEVNGLKADFATDGAYWAFYVNDEYAQNGIDTQPLYDGNTIALKYEK